MCGIVGLIGKNQNKANKNDIKRMLAKISHRGPDAEGIYVNGAIGLGHCRLSIIDLSPAGNQPMTDTERKLVIVYNGEIYNYLELKNELESMGHVFCNNTDTEVILEAYKAWGDECVQRFNGMWSFALYDPENEKVLLSRDRFGVKPLYLYENDDYVVFASEIKCITELFPEEKTPDIVQIVRYLNRIQEDRDSHTFYANIVNFPKRTNGMIDLNTGEITYSTYWKLNRSISKAGNIRIYSQFRDLIEDAVRIRLRADVPVGASLSGGLDSSSIVGIAKKRFHTGLKTFSTIYPDADCNEENFIELANRYSNLEHCYIYPDEEKNLLDRLADMIYYHDGPCVSASPYSGFCVYQKASEQVKVMLDGQGADELLGGYLFFYKSYLNDLLGQGKKARAAKLIKKIAAIWSETFKTLDQDMVLHTVGQKNYMKLQSVVKMNLEKVPSRAICSKRLKKVNDELSSIDSYTGHSELSEAMYRSFDYDILPRILHDVDRNSMAFSVEVRLPFLDYRLVEFCAALEDKYKIKNTWTKMIMRVALRRYLPWDIRTRKNKMGFPAPFSRWIREPEYLEQIRQLLQKIKKRNLVDPEAVDLYLEQQLSGTKDRTDAIFKMVSLELWLERDIDTQDLFWTLA